MNKTQAGRVFTLAHFLRTRVPEKEFDINTFGTCKTPACAMGWATEVFEEIIWNDGEPALKGSDYTDIEEGWRAFFGFTEAQSDFFNAPYMYPEWYSESPKKIADLLDSWANEAGWEVVQ